MLDLDREIKERDKLITTQFHTHPWAKIIESMPGMGPGLGAEFLVVTGGNLTTFGSSGRLASYARLVPAPRCSGRITAKLLRPRHYNRRLRPVFYMAALSSLRVAGPCRRCRTASPGFGEFPEWVDDEAAIGPGGKPPPGHVQRNGPQDFALSVIRFRSSRPVSRL